VVQVLNLHQNKQVQVKNPHHNIRGEFLVMPNPKRRHSKSRGRKRRTHDALETVQLVVCSNCGSKRLPHRVCASCGYYNQRSVIRKDM
jgi:large subunit ribosomal protein L32